MTNELPGQEPFDEGAPLGACREWSWQVGSDRLLPNGGPPSSFSAESLGIDRLSVRDRLDLIEQIWDSLPVSAHHNYS